MDYRPEISNITTSVNQQSLCLRLFIIADDLPEDFEDFTVSITAVVPQVDMIVSPNLATVIIEGIVCQ